MPTSRAYDTRYAIHPNMLTHDLHGLHAVIINMDLRVHGHVLYKRRHACSTTTNGCLGCHTSPLRGSTMAQPWLNHGSTNGSACTLQVHYVAQHDCWRLTRVHEHAGSGATHLLLRLVRSRNVYRPRTGGDRRDRWRMLMNSIPVDLVLLVPVRLYNNSVDLVDLPVHL
eukprot:COSAG05_NODE_319_length_11483_cov_406.525604_10_plen_169_part_00